MKTYIKALLIILLAAQFSCDMTRIDMPSSSNTEASYFSNQVEFRNNLVSAYSKLYDFYHYNANWAGDWTHSLWYLPGDDITETTGARSAEELFDGSLNPNNGRISWFFDKAYELIARANVTLEKTRTVDFSNFDGAEEIAMMEGECLFLRSYVYFKLFNVNGSVPIVIERITTKEGANTPKSDKIEVLNQVISDLELAVGIVPDSWSSEYAGRVTKNAVRALLVKALVFRANYTNNKADYTQAISVFNSISAILMPIYTDNFNAAVENNDESCFEIQASQAVAADNIWLFNDGPWRGVEDMGVYRGASTENGTFCANIAPTKFIITKKLFNNFGTDPRIKVFLSQDDGFQGLLFQKYTLSGMDHHTPPYSNSANNERVLRYADIKLLAAEAYLGNDNMEAAIQQINDIRTRARKWALTVGINDGISPADYSATETNKTIIMQWIMDERFVEMAGEGQRWWDLKRWHEAGYIDLTNWSGGDEHFSTNLSSPVKFDVSKHLVFPIPQAEIDRNSGIVENNPGY
ncbi:RagB/SusD family nutrient uptake outer membrane protein [Maribellus luteus]|uniref:RagB/SusD family nutrient uptake outer membrane protein n=1 Tax=Maribellus luteus TaxID=2305463 RepID=A0A399T5X4_9BACT|nr:RagB/SusD family nutrient uptake outer membrane protein [Maribellus luteus]RIJ50549.1 RagB/SusD family nutrient uptake outer membrane protein [Maribellus luteus]